jgi:S-adenosylmethionine hydrolase
MIALFTDFGWQGPYVGQMKLALARQAKGVAVIDLMHDAPQFNISASSYLLAALAKQFPAGTVCCAVVDPGVGHVSRKPVALFSQGCWFVGPGNGLFATLALDDVDSQWYEIVWAPKELSNSFHGRDLFAPVAARLAKDEAHDGLITRIDMDLSDWPRDSAEVIYIDAYGNCITGLRAEGIGHHFRIGIGETLVSYAPTFAYAEKGGLFWYENSAGLIEIAANQDSAARALKAHIGQVIRVLGHV